MRPLKVINQITLDGFYEGAGEGWDRINWHRVNDEWDAMSIVTLKAAGTILFGRVTYEGFASYWPAEEGEIARLLTEADKVVVSRTLKRADWNNSRLLQGDLATGIAALKNEPGGPIIVYGSGTLVQGLTDLGLVDFYELAIVPVAIGSGTPLFRPGAPRLDMELVSSRTLANGVIYTTCRPR
jgi:dihydrofolate reductase